VVGNCGTPLGLPIGRLTYLILTKNSNLDNILLLQGSVKAGIKKSIDEAKVKSNSPLAREIAALISFSSPGSGSEGYLPYWECGSGSYLRSRKWILSKK
jgi:hypothetical protein